MQSINVALTPADDPLHAVAVLVETELVLEPGALQPDERLADLRGADSVKLLRVIARLERLYNVEFDDDEVFGAVTARDLAALVVARRSGPA